MCCSGDADGCIPLTMLVDARQCCRSLMFVCLPLSRHFPCRKTWRIENLNLNLSVTMLHSAGTQHGNLHQILLTTSKVTCFTDSADPPHWEHALATARNMWRENLIWNK